MSSSAELPEEMRTWAPTHPQPHTRRNIVLNHTHTHIQTGTHIYRCINGVHIEHEAIK